MFDEGTPSPGASADGVFTNRSTVCVTALLIFGTVLLGYPCTVFAQRGGGGRGGIPGTGTVGSRRPVICLHDCPSTQEGASSEDDLKNFQHLMAVQATEQQSAAFISVVQDAQAAGAQLQAFRELLQKAPASSLRSDRAAELDQAIAKARTGNRSFLASFSPTQQSGLKDLTKKLEEADSGLDKETRALDEIVHADKADSEHIASSTTNLDKALAGFQSGQIALASEMSIILPSGGQELTFNVPPHSLLFTR